MSDAKAKEEETRLIKKRTPSISLLCCECCNLLVLYLFYFYFNTDRFLLLGLWGFIILSMALLLWYYGREAAAEFMDLYRG